MVVYRLEYREEGIFNGTKQMTTWADDAMYTYYGCTVGGVWGDNAYRFGCRTIDKLIEYFGSDFAKLISDGASIVEVEILRKYVRFSPRGFELAYESDKAKRTIILKGL